MSLMTKMWVLCVCVKIQCVLSGSQNKVWLCGRASAHGAMVVGSIPHGGRIELFHIPASAA